ncbi:hypothetical protein [Absidia glauca]|uniref:Box C/D snoRNA protein 1 n=1 Tax=Absidia glauca TaxID=4829 RepID=A0A168KWP4_ABSGL|nr:hypothetical protein [Absidia glauca]
MASSSIPIDDFATLSPPSLPSIEVDTSTCQVCHQAASKYKCPRCNVRSCSVVCVKQHKADQSCSGERSKTHYVPMKEYNESNMMSDYVYLEDVSRQSDTLTRHRIKDNKTTSPADYKLKMVVKNARGMGVLYDMLPAGMSKRKANRTNYSTKKRQLFWTMEFLFCMDDAQERVMEHSCPGNKTLQSVFENMLLSEKPFGQNSYATIRHQVRHFVDVDMKDWVVALKKEGGKRNTFINLTPHMDDTLMDCLKGERVIEYPTVYIWLKDHMDCSIQLEDKYTEQPQDSNKKGSNDSEDSGSTSSGSDSSDDSDSSDADSMSDDDDDDNELLDSDKQHSELQDGNALEHDDNQKVDGEQCDSTTTVGE